jgi:hypothetical protein
MSNYIKINRNDRQYIFTKSAVHDAIDKLKNEMLRLTNLSRAEKKNFEKIIKLDEQINYLEELLSAYEKDEKKL